MGRRTLIRAHDGSMAKGARSSHQRCQRKQHKSNKKLWATTATTRNRHETHIQQTYAPAPPVRLATAIRHSNAAPPMQGRPAHPRRSAAGTVREKRRVSPNLPRASCRSHGRSSKGRASSGGRHLSIQPVVGAMLQVEARFKTPAANKTQPICVTPESRRV